MTEKQLIRSRRRIGRAGFDSRARPETCARILQLTEAQFLPWTANTFAQCRRQWLTLTAEARLSNDLETEKTVNAAWQRLKAWQCPICKGLKPRARNQSCNLICARIARRNTIRKTLGPIILKLNPQTGQPTGHSVRGNGLRQAQYQALKQAIEKANHCLAEAARQLKMSYSTAKYYVRKFGGYLDGHRATLSFVAGTLLICSCQHSRPTTTPRTKADDLPPGPPGEIIGRNESAATMPQPTSFPTGQPIKLVWTHNQAPGDCYEIWQSTNLTDWNQADTTTNKEWPFVANLPRQFFKLRARNVFGMVSDWATTAP